MIVTGHDGQAEPDSRAILRRMLVMQQIGLFVHFSQEDVKRLASRVEEVEYAANDSIFLAGDDGDAMYGIIEGSVRVHRGAEMLATLGVGECFGEMAIIDGEARSADCTASGPTVLLRMNRNLVISYCFQRIGVLKGTMRVLAERLRGMQASGDN
jgi:CRP-like cAMP-binding protein